MNSRFATFAMIALGLLVTGAYAQTVFKSSCMHGVAVQEPVGEGKTVYIGTSTCIAHSGPLQGVPSSHHEMWEIDAKGAGTLVSGIGLLRTQGSLAAFTSTSGSFRTLMRDGKAVGWEGEGAGVYNAANGAASAFNGKQFKWTGRTTGPGTFELETKVD